MGTSYSYTTSAATPDPALVEAWTKMTKPQRTAYLRQGAVLGVTGAERRAEKARLVKQAGGN